MIRGAGFPFGCAVCEVEIDPDTGKIEIARYTAIDDVGRAINPLILHGQTHGGIVQGVGQALWEHSHYDPETGQLLAGSMMDYAMPRAHMLPSFNTELSESWRRAIRSACAAAARAAPRRRSAWWSMP